MASSSYNKNNPNSSIHPFPPNFDPNSIPNTTFVQADPTTFRSVVQQLTGKPMKPSFKLHERRPTARKLEIQLNNGCGPNNTVMVSPVSPLELMMMTAARESPRSPMEEEEKAIAEKGFYFHPSPMNNTPRGSNPPELLPLFPIHSTRDNDDDDNTMRN